MKRKLFKLLFLFFLVISGNIYSQSDSSLIDQDVLDLKNLKPFIDKNSQKVISASRTSKLISDLPVTIYVVTREEIIKNNYTTLVDVLKDAPGMRTSQPGSGDMGETFQMRGMFGNNYAKILVNNIPIKTSVVDGLAINGQLPIRQAERIEIIYGPTSALYGADATIGVINIITKQPTTGIYATADLNIIGKRFINFSVGGKAGKNQNIINYNLYGGMTSKHNINITTTSDVFRPLSYLDQTHKPITINNEKVLFSELTNDQIIEQRLTNIAYKPNYEGDADSFPIENLPTQSYYSGILINYRALTFSLQNMYRKTHSSIGRTPYLYKYNDPKNYIAEHLNTISLSHDKQLGNFNNNLNLYINTAYLDKNSNYGVTYVKDKDELYIYYNGMNTTLEELLTYSHKFFEITGGLSVQYAINTPHTNYLFEPYKETLQTKIVTSIAHQRPSTELSEFGFNLYSYIATGEFIQTYFKFDKLIIMGGIRHDFNSLYNINENTYKDTNFTPPIDSLPPPTGNSKPQLNDGSDASSFSPRLAILYKITKSFSVRASYGEAFKPPAGNKIFHSIAYPAIIDNDTGYFYEFIPNLTLKPEYYSSLEFGIRKNFFDKKIQLDLSIYHNQIKNLITISYINPTKLHFEKSVNNENNLAKIYVNSLNSTATCNGLSFILKFNNIIKKIKLNTQITGTFILKGHENLANNEKIDYIRGTPKYIGNIKIELSPFKKMNITINNYWASKSTRQFLPTTNYYANDYYENIKGYFVSDIYTNLKLHENINLYLKITNITNTQYGGIDATGTDIDLQYNPQLNRNIILGVTFLLN